MIYQTKGHIKKIEDGGDRPQTMLHVFNFCTCLLETNINMTSAPDNKQCEDDITLEVDILVSICILGR